LEQKVVEFKANPWQRAAFRDKSPIMLLDGPSGTGKSHIACEKINAFCKKYSGVTVLMIRKVKSSLVNSTVAFFEHKIIGDDPDVEHFSSKRRFEYKNGSMIVYGGMNDEQQREQLRSIGSSGGVEMAFLEEANKLSRDDFTEVRTRMRGPNAPWTQIIVATNPDHAKHWINQDMILGKQASRPMFGAKAADNPGNSKQYVNDMSQLTGIARDRFWHGIWKDAEGLVFPEFQDNIHISKYKFTPPPEWPRFRAIDFGSNHPFVCQWWALDPAKNHLWLYREIYKTDTIIQDHAKKINELSKDEQFEWSVSDHDRGDRKTLERYGISTLKAKKDIQHGLQVVRNRLAAKSIFIMPGARVHPADPVLIKRRAPTCTEEEFSRYIWADKNEKEVPVDKDNHGIDSLRYLLMQKDEYSSGAEVITMEDIKRPLTDDEYQSIYDEESGAFIVAL
jgi:phage terminase large subunit